MVKKLKILDLFSGIGGFSLGLERTGGFETVAFCEVDKKARLVLNKHWPDLPVFDDVKTLTKEKLDEQGISVDVICGGFPCQDISLAGRGAGLAGERSGLWFEFHRLIQEIRPSWVIAENVSALRSRGLDQVLRSLSEIGYDAEWHCIPASAVGAPHQRDRIWIVAYPNCNGQRPWDGSEQPTWHTAGERIGDSRSVGISGMVADAAGKGLSEWGRSKRETSPEKAGTGLVSKFERCSEDVADTKQQGRKGRLYWWADKKRESELGYFGRCSSIYGQQIQDWWATEPDVGRVAHGVPGRVDRLKQLGNAVVPQIPELLGYAILDEIKNATS